MIHTIILSVIGIFAIADIYKMIAGPTIFDRLLAFNITFFESRNGDGRLCAFYQPGVYAGYSYHIYAVVVCVYGADCTFC